MKKLSIPLLFCVLISMCFVACTSKSIKTEEKDLSKRYYLDKDTTKGALHLDFQIEIPTAFSDTTVLKSVKDTIISFLFGSDYIHLHKDSILQAVASDCYDSFIDDNKSIVNVRDTVAGYTLKYENIVSGFSLLSDSHIYVYGVERYIYLGGERGNETRNFINFDLSNGKVLREKDLFVAGYEKELINLIKQQILEDCKAEPVEKNSEPILTLEDTGYWVDAIKPNSNFYITDESINYVFNPYEIATFSMGQTEVVLPYSKLIKLLKPNSAINYLVEKYQKTNKL